MRRDTDTAPDLIVVGGGVIGLSIAWRAARAGLRPLLLERDAIGQGTSRHAAGMLAPNAEVAPAEEPLLALGLRSAAAYPQFVRELADDAERSEAALGYTTCSTLLVARDRDEAEALDREHALRERLSLSTERLLPSAARRREPALAPALRLALHLPADHAVDPRALTAALRDAIIRRGGEIREQTEVVALRDGGVQTSDGARLDALSVVVAAGVWSGALAPDAPALRPVKGQIMRLHDPAGPGMLQHVVRMGPSYVVPRGDGRYVIGATSEERGFDVTVTAGAAHDLLRDAAELVPGVSELVIDEFTAGLRPGTADNLPIIGPAARPGVIWATGHFRGGVLLAPATAELVLGLLRGDAGDPLLAVFSPERGRAGAPAGAVA